MIPEHLREKNPNARTPTEMRALQILADLVDSIETSGGVRWKNGAFELAGDPDWNDLVNIYYDACGLLGKQMKESE